MYREILANKMLQFANDRMPAGWIYQQDNDPKHTSHLMMGALRNLPDGRKVRLPGWFSLNGIRLLKWPPNSPDLNPIEQLWQIVKQQLRGNRFENKDLLWHAVNEAWNSSSLDILISLVDSMPRRINAVINSRGGHTKY